MIKSDIFKKILSIAAVFAVTASCFCCYVRAEESDLQDVAQVTYSFYSYDDYISDAEIVKGDTVITLKPEYDSKIGEYDVKTVSEGGLVSFSAVVQTEGWYNIGLAFMPSGITDRYSVSLMLNGKIPFIQAEEIDFYSAFSDEDEIKTDEAGNDIRPDSSPAEKLQKEFFRDAGGSYSEPYMFYLTSGENTFELTVKSGELAVNEFIIKQIGELKSYEEYKAEMLSKPQNEVSSVFIEAETPDFKSGRSVIANTDRSGPDSTYNGGKVNDAFALKLNVLSDENFKYQNQWVEYEFNAPATGFYKISMRVRQNLQEGLFTSRRIYIDGEVPFKELDAIEFSYDDSWYIKTLGDSEPYLIYLEKGTHSIKIEVTAGVLAELSKEFSSELDDLNGIYRDIFMVTGSSPNMYMDYDLAGQISDLTERFAAVNERLKASLERLVEISGGRKGTGFSVMDALIVQIDDFVTNPDTIEDRVSAFKDNCSAFGSWISTLKEQPLGIDSIELTAANTEAYSQSAGFFSKLLFQLKVLIGSFITDYDSISADAEKASLNVWVMNGREQAQIIKNLSKNYFETEKNTKVEISVVTTGLVEATLAGTGPDVALFVPETTPVFMGARKVLSDLSDYEGFDTLKSRYDSELLVPYSYKEAVYGIPLTYDMPMLFYRTDIFEELGLECPENWAEFYDAVSVIQNSLMDVGVPSTLFETLLYQKGGSYFNEELDTCVLDSDEGVEAFEQVTEFFTDHAMPVSFDFYNRFRTGEMPMAVAAYSNYMTLDFAAPEISGLWKMASIPSNGETEKYLKGESTAAVMFEKTENKDIAMEFLLWFTDAETQGLYGQEIEIVLGAVGRHKPANKEALKYLGWSVDERELILSQFEVVREIPVIPSSYYISRSFNNAFRKVVYSGENARETLLLYVRDINKEIARKQEAMSE